MTPSHSSLHEQLRVVRGTRRERDGYFLRAESLFNVASEIERLGPVIAASYGSRSLHDQSHGESFMALLTTRFREQRRSEERWMRRERAGELVAPCTIEPAPVRHVPWRPASSS